MNQLKTQIYNFKTQQYERGAPWAPDQQADWSDYIPQDPAVQGIYRCYVHMGKSPAIVALHALHALYASVGETFQEQTP